MVAFRTFKFAITYQCDPRVTKLDYFFFIQGRIAHELPVKNRENLSDCVTDKISMFEQLHRI